MSVAEVINVDRGELAACAQKLAASTPLPARAGCGIAAGTRGATQALSERSAE